MKKRTVNYTLRAASAAMLVALSAIQTHGQISKPKRPYIEWSARPDSPDWKYAVGERARIDVEIRASGMPTDGTWVRYTIGDEMRDETMRTDSAQTKGGKLSIDMGTRTTPGFRACKIEFTEDGESQSDLLKVGYGVEKIVPGTENPKDFDRFWAETIAAARQIDLSPVVTPIESMSTEHVAAYKVRLTVGSGDRHIFGYLSVPRDGKRHPVILIPPGAGVKMDKYTDYYAERGYVSMSIEIHGLDPDLPDSVRAAVRTAKRDYMGFGIESRDGYYYRDVYAGCVRAMDYLCSLPEWDGKSAGVIGGSQGGALSLVTAALHEQVDFVAAFYPALCDVCGFADGRTGGWPRFFSKRYVGKSDIGDTAKARRTLAYYDVVNFARRIKVPGFYNYGYADDVCSPTSVAAALSVIKSPKHIVVTPTSGHWRFTQAQDEMMRQMDSILK